MVFIHGESYMWGSGNIFDGRVLSSYGEVLVVTVNYRLGILGFLNTNISPHQNPQMANYGLMDQIAALKWIQQNIENFGGNPNAVTLFGHKTGAACIHFLMQSPIAVSGLFHRGILMSGSATASWALVEDPVHYAVQLAGHLNCSVPRNMLQHHADIVRCLRAKPLSDLYATDLKAPSFLIAMGPSRDGVLIPSDFGTTVVSVGKRSVSPAFRVILGVSENVARNLFSESQRRNGIKSHESDRLLRTLVRNTYTYHLNEIYYTVQNEYSDYSNHGLPQTKDLVSHALSDKLYISPVLEAAAWCNESGYPAYLYVHKEDESETNGELLQFVFGVPFAPEIATFSFRSSPKQGLLTQSILTYWSNFAHSGVPNLPSTIGNLFGAERAGSRPLTNWEPYRLISQNYLEIDVDPVMRQHYRPHPMSIWLKLIPKLHLAGSENIFPRQPSGQGDHALFTGVIRHPSYTEVEVNRAAIGQLTTGPPPTPCTQTRDNIYLNHNATLVKIEEAGQAAYNKAVFLILFLGAILLAGNVWFWLCFILRRGNLCCEVCVGSSVRKETSCETELVGVSSLSLQSPKNQSFHRREYTDDSVSYKGSVSPPRKRIYSKDYDSYSTCGESYRMINGGQAISFISSHDGSRPEGGLVPCLKQSSLKQPVPAIATLPRNSRHSRETIQKLGSQLESQTTWSPGRDRTVARSSSAHEHIVSGEGKVGTSVAQASPSPRPKLSTFCHLVAPEAGGGRATIRDDSRQTIHTIQAVTAPGYDLNAKFMPPESV